MEESDGKVMTGALLVLAGAILGAGLALLIAPQSGKDTRRDIARYARCGRRRPEHVARLHRAADVRLHVRRVGHGLVLAAVGFGLRDRVPTLRLLVPGGVAACGFGFVFGSVFCLETVVHPLWLLPLAAPLPVLVVPLVAGAVLLTVGLLIELLEAWWQQRLAHWARDDAPALLVYLGEFAFGAAAPGRLAGGRRRRGLGRRGRVLGCGRRRHHP